MLGAYGDGATGLGAVDAVDDVGDLDSLGGRRDGGLNVEAVAFGVALAESRRGRWYGSGGGLGGTPGYVGDAGDARAAVGED